MSPWRRPARREAWRHGPLLAVEMQHLVELGDAARLLAVAYRPAVLGRGAADREQLVESAFGCPGLVRHRDREPLLAGPVQHLIHRGGLALDLADRPAVSGRVAEDPEEFLGLGGGRGRAGRGQAAPRGWARRGSRSGSARAGPAVLVAEAGAAALSAPAAITQAPNSTTAYRLGFLCFPALSHRSHPRSRQLSTGARIARHADPTPPNGTQRRRSMVQPKWQRRGRPGRRVSR